jgi:DNA-directed RNA polymerase sigma subunit (sigma70/sigma32)
MNIQNRNQEILTLFTNNKKTISQLSLIFKISKERIRQILVEHNVSIKQFHTEKESQLITQIQACINENPHLSRLQIAKHFNLSIFKIENLIRKSGIKLNRGKIASNAKLSNNNKNRLKLTKEVLHQLYVIENKTLNQMAENLNCPRATVARYLKRFHIPARQKGRPSMKKPTK